MKQMSMGKTGVKLDDRDKNGLTPLMFVASINANPEVIITLLKAGAKAILKSNEGMSAFDYAGGGDKLKGTEAYWELKRATF